jgi:hypothetical protein
VTERFEEFGSHSRPGPYDGVLEKPCTNCGAVVDEKCWQDIHTAGTTQRVHRNHPCLVRLLGEKQ